MKVILTKGFEAIIDDEDYAKIENYKWRLRTDSNGFKYAHTEVNGTTRSMHRIILGLLPGDPRHVDHINHNGLDNRRNNIRIVTVSQNHMNGKIRRDKDKSSQYKGVNYASRESKWRAYITIEGKFKSLGYFETEQEAAKAYDMAAKEYFSEYAFLNEKECVYCQKKFKPLNLRMYTCGQYECKRQRRIEAARRYWMARRSSQDRSGSTKGSSVV